MRPKRAVFFLVILLSSILLPPPAGAAEQAWRRRASSGEETTQADIAAEMDFGRQLAARILGRYPVYHEPRLTRYVNLVGNAVALSAAGPDTPFHFAVLDTDDMQGYAAPGAYVFITRGTLALIRDEAELAGVLAHEIGHITGKHMVTRLKVRAPDELLIASFGSLISGGQDAVRAAAAQALENAVDILVAGQYLQEEDRDADRAGLLLCALSGYDPSGLVRYLERLRESRVTQAPAAPEKQKRVEERIAWTREIVQGEGLDAGVFMTGRARFAEMVRSVQ